VINETDTQKGTVYYRRAGKEIQMMADITDPAKGVLFSGGRVEVYEPKLNRVTTYEAGKNREAVESFLVLGFGGGGHEMLTSGSTKKSPTARSSSRPGATPSSYPPPRGKLLYPRSQD
jgi:hypothetical protein